MHPSHLLLLPVCLALTWLGVGLQRRIALSRGIIDVPNARSSHDRPVPRGGGLAIVAVASAGFAAMAALAVIPGALALALVVPGLLVAGIGFADDLKGVTALARLCVQLAAAALALYFLGGWAAETARAGSAAWLLLHAVLAVGIAWSVNLFNFMDGIDGIAGSEAAFLGLGGAVLLWTQPAAPGVAVAALIVGACSLGFLVWNWPPAKIFMGDVGSGYLGLVFAVLALASARGDPRWLSAWAILGATFLADSGVTLARRLLRRERVYQAHRTHAYQWLARRYGSHARATSLYLAIDVLWLLPLAWLSLRLPDRAPWLVVAAFAPVLAGAWIAGAGRPEPGAGG
jgi:Fuc2NAc and GlcNAc transferase